MIINHRGTGLALGVRQSFAATCRVIGFGDVRDSVMQDSVHSLNLGYTCVVVLVQIRFLRNPFSSLLTPASRVCLLSMTLTFK